MTPPAGSGEAEKGAPPVFMVGKRITEQLYRDIMAGLAEKNVRATLHIGSIASAREDPDFRNAEILVSTEPVTATDLNAAPRLHTLISPTLGYDHLDIGAATARKILVMNGHVVENFESMAEATMLLVLAAVYDLPRALASINGGAQGRRARMLKGKTIGIIGYGNIAQALIRRLENWQVSILVSTRSPPALSTPGFRFAPLDTLLAESDIVVMLASLNEGSRHLLNADRLAQMKAGAILVNTSRGGLIDETALAALLAQRRISRVALDVFETEPLPIDSPLRTMADAIVTAHNIGHTAESIDAVVDGAVRNIVHAVRGDPPATALNPEMLQHWRQRASRRG